MQSWSARMCMPGGGGGMAKVVEVLIAIFCCCLLQWSVMMQIFSGGDGKVKLVWIVKRCEIIRLYDLVRRRERTVYGLRPAA